MGGLPQRARGFRVQLDNARVFHVYEPELFDGPHTFHCKTDKGNTFRVTMQGSGVVVFHPNGVDSKPFHLHTSAIAAIVFLKENE